ILDLRIVYENEGGDVGPQYQMTDENIASAKMKSASASSTAPNVYVHIEATDDYYLPTIDINSTVNDGMIKAVGAKGRGRKRTADQGPSSNSNNTSAKNARRARKCKISVNVTDEGMLRLVDEWQWNTKNQLIIHPLPRPNTVDDILEEFYEFKIEEIKEQTKSTGRNRGRISKSQETSIREIINGIRQYFNEALPIYLLYRFERQQYVEMTEKYPKKFMSSIYGAEHLMRLVVKIPDLVHGVQMKEQKAEILEKIFNELAT
ncbi:11822_t:CDS:2, partial [Acaulospora colombiana]